MKTTDFFCVRTISILGLFQNIFSNVTANIQLKVIYLLKESHQPSIDWNGNVTLIHHNKSQIIPTLNKEELYMEWASIRYDGYCFQRNWIKSCFVFIKLSNRVMYVYYCLVFFFSHTFDKMIFCIMFSNKLTLLSVTVRAPSQYPKRRLFVRSHKALKPRDWYFRLSYCFEIWQAHRQHCCRSACQISKRSDNSKYKSHSFETWRDLTKRRLFGYWDGALVFQSWMEWH